MTLSRAGSRPLPQDPALASKAPRLKKTDGLIDWTRPAAAIKNQIRAMEPWPKTYTFWHRPGRPAAAADPRPGGGSRARVALASRQCCRGALARRQCHPSRPGRCRARSCEAGDGRLTIAAARGAIQLRGVQPAGERRMEIEEFLRGYHLRPGERFGPEELPSPS